MTFKEKLAKAFRLRTYTQNWITRLLYLTPAQRREREREHLKRERNRQEGERRRISEEARKRREALVDKLRQGIDQAGLQEINALGEIKDRVDIFWTKYLDVDRWLDVNVRHAEDLGLLDHPPTDVLDLGCGAGYFLLVCRALGARVLGIDVDADQVLNRMIALFKLERWTVWIKPMEKLPDFRRQFDLITGFMICFNFPTLETYWSVEDWNFFLDDLLTYLKPDGRIYFSLNKQPDGEHYTAEIKQNFLNRGAVIDGKRVLLNYADLKRTVNQPTALAHSGATDV